MLIIRQEQINALMRETDEAFVERLVGYVKERQPEAEKEYDEETLHNMVRGGIERAKSRNFKTAEDITAYVLLMFKFAPNFDEQPDIKAIFEDNNIAPEQRFDQLQSPTFPKKAWREAKRIYDSNAWVLKPKESTSNPPQEQNQ